MTDQQEQQKNDTDSPLIVPLPPKSGQTTKPGSSVVQKMRAKRSPAIFLVVVSVLAGFLGGYLGAGTRDSQSGDTTQTRVVLEGESDVISTIADEVGGSVVSVNVKGESQTRGFFGFSSGEQESAGTGVIISKDGLIITNRHVVPANTTEVSVTLSDGTNLDDVSVIGRTRSSDTLDIAFLKINDTKGKKLVAAKIGDSSKVSVGDQVVAIGNALGQFQNTVTSGIISGFGRSVQASSDSGTGVESLEGLFQTDAAINQGNSGGPLVNLAGEVIGINTAVAAGDAQNIGFAIPINDIKGLISTVEETGKLERPYLGVIYIPLTSDTAQEYGLSVTRGAYILPEAVAGQDPIVTDSPASKAGLRGGDVITKINDTTINERTTLTAALDKYRVGDEVTVTIIRNGQEEQLKTKLEVAPN